MKLLPQNKSSYSLLLLLALLLSLATHAKVIINEISDSGTANACDGQDWIELYNTDAVETIDLGGGSGQEDKAGGYVLHDSQGIQSNDAFSFPVNTTIGPREYLLLCTKMETDSLPWLSPQFGIGSDETITLLRVVNNNNNNNDLEGIVTVLPLEGRMTGMEFETVSQVNLPGQVDRFGVTYALDPDTGLWNYTATPTPGSANTMARILTPQELAQEHKQELAQQNALGAAFFNMDERGYPVQDAMDTVLDLKVTMEPRDYEYLMTNTSYEEYSPFQSAQVATKDGTIVTSLNSPGRLRPKGQSTLYTAICLGINTFPFQIDFDDTNSSQTLFGVQRAILRHHARDYSYSREWAYYRMLARFGLPHLRARTVRFYINDNLHGLYTLLEAPEQEYVFARSFPNYNPLQYALYKVKTLAPNCGGYSEEELAIAMERKENGEGAPYEFERGEHREKIETLGLSAFGECAQAFSSWFHNDVWPDVVLAYVNHDRDCAEMMLDEGVIDRDLEGAEHYDGEMKDLIRDHLVADVNCNRGCTNSDLAQQVDQENWLKTFAFYAVTLNLDSPMTTFNNFYFARTDDGMGWKLVTYDLNYRETRGCQNEICNSRFVHWSIARPTCRSLEDNKLVGPLLTNATLHAQYLTYVREFTETIYANQTFWGEIQQHIEDSKIDIISDFWAVYGAFIDDEVSPTAAEWNGGEFPLLPVMKARSEDVQAQLDAIDGQRYPRGPHGVGLEGDYEPLEVCPDWRYEMPNTTSCELGCLYEGCHMPGWTIESYCDEETGNCFSGDADPMCWGVADGSRYQGMENTTAGREKFCRLAEGMPAKIARCPAVGAASSLSGASSSMTALLSVMFALLCATALALV